MRMSAKTFKIKTINWYFGDLCEEMKKFLDGSYREEKDMPYSAATKIVKEIADDPRVTNYDVIDLDDVEAHYFMLKYPKYVKRI